MHVLVTVALFFLFCVAQHLLDAKLWY